MLLRFRYFVFVFLNSFFNDYIIILYLNIIPHNHHHPELKMLEIVLEYLTSIYVLPILATIIGLCIVYIYDLFEKKQFKKSL